MDFIKLFLQKIIEIKEIIAEIVKAGGTSFLVGGSVRDLVLSQKDGSVSEISDFDIEVHGISLEVLERCLRRFGKVSLVGRKFGVLRLHGFEIDWSLPRRDSKGRKPSVELDPTLSIEEACRRRDVSMNAMAIDLNEVCRNINEIQRIVASGSCDINSLFGVIDPVGGLDAIANKRLSVVDEILFIDDPLRFYRVMQFVGRFEMEPDDQLNEVCRRMDLTVSTDGGELARERIYEEIKKLFLKSRRPSLGFRWVKKIGRLKELFPEIEMLVGLIQRSDYHPEGDVFEHTMQTLDAIALWPIEVGGYIATEYEKFIIMLGALCHDFGKAETTDRQGHCRGHEEAGIVPTKNFLMRFTWDSLLVRTVCKLVRFHRMPLLLVHQESTSKAYKRLAKQLAPEVNAQYLYVVAWADVRGRNKDGESPLLKALLPDEDRMLETFLMKIKEAKVETGPEAPILLGRDLLEFIEPGPKMGVLLKRAYNLQVEEGIVDKAVLLKMVLGHD